MKKVIIIVLALACAAMVSGCGVAVPIADGAATLSVKSKKSKKVTVYVDGQRHEVKTVSEKKADTAKQTTKNTIEVPEGSHEVTVKKDDQEVKKETVNVSADSHNTVEIKEEEKKTSNVYRTK